MNKERYWILGILFGLMIGAMIMWLATYKLLERISRYNRVVPNVLQEQQIQRKKDGVQWQEI